MTTRRRFFQLLAGAALAPVAAKAAAILPSVPLLYGDGAHDDTAALNALLRGDVVEFGPKLSGDGGWGQIIGRPLLRLPSGQYRITGPVRMANMPDGAIVDFTGSVVHWEHSGSAIEVEDCQDLTIMGGAF